MKKHRLTSLILAMLMLFQTLPVLAEAVDDVTLFPTDDSYIVSGSRGEYKNYGNAATMLFGNAYDRTALIKFDISSVDLSAYNGALLNITFNASVEEGAIDVYIASDGWTEDNVTYSNFPQDYSFAISCDIVNGAGKKLSLTLNKALQWAKETGSKYISVSLKSKSGCITAFSSESSDISLRPSLTLTQEPAYVKGQKDFQLPQITKEQFKAEMTSAIEKGHPYIIANKGYIDKVKQYAFGKDKTLTEIYSWFKEEADALIEADIQRITVDVKKASYIGTAQTAWKNTMTLGLVYLVEGDDRYAQKAYEQAEYFCNLDSWGTYQLIDNVQTAFCVALCYDWLYDWLSSEQKEVLTKGIRTHHLNMMSDLLKNPSKQDYQIGFYTAALSTGNHGMMDISCTFLAAMAFADTDMDFMTELMQLTQNQVNVPISHIYPDGAVREGISYWNFVGPYIARFMQSLKSAFGHCFGYEEIDFLKKLEDHPLYGSSDYGSFTANDMHFGHEVGNLPEFYMIGALKDDVALMSYALEQVKLNKNPDAPFILLYDVNKEYNADAFTMSLDKYFRNYDLVTMRSSFNGDQNAFAGMVVDGKTGISGHMGAGSIGFDALGERWITNHGRENYYTGYWTEVERYTWYRTRTESQSCIVIDPSEYRGQEIGIEAGIDIFESEAGGVYAITDLINAYKPQVDSYKRGVQLIDNREIFVVQDEIDLKKPSEMYSFFNIYLADIELLDDGKSAILHKNNKKVYVTVDCDKEFTLGTMFAEPLPTSPMPAASKPNSPNPDFMKLFIHFDSVESANIRVCFIPYICEEELSAVTCKEFVPMSEWVAPREIKTTPMLDDIKIDGISLEGFNPYNRCYDIDAKISTSQLTPVYDNSKYDVTVQQDSKTGAVNVLLVDKSDASNMNSYTVCVPPIPEPSYVDISKMSLIPIVNTTAPEPQAENPISHLYDGDIATRWSANGAGTVMTITLDKVREVGCVAMNHYDGDGGRRQNFDVSLSLDGKTWTSIGRFRSSGVTLDKEYYDLKNTKAQYVKITYNVTNEGNWNSVCELEFYGK